MTIFNLEALITLSDTLNFTKASTILHTTQPNLSKIIVNLEQEVGVQLLIRNKRDVKLTPAGEAFCQEARKLLKQYESAIEIAKIVDAGIHGVINMGFLGTALIALLPNIVNTFSKRYPKIRLNLADYTYSPLMNALADDEIDIALLPDRELDTIPKLAKKYIFSDSMCLVVSKDHKYADETIVDLSKACDEDFIMMDPKISIRDYELVTSMCVEQDFIPNVVYEANTLNNLILMIECNKGVSILAKHMLHFATDNVRFLDIKGYESYFKIVCAWRKGANTSVPKLIEVIDECAGQHEQK